MGGIRKERLDVWLVERGLATSRDAARRIILAGKVRVNDQPASKPGKVFDETVRIQSLEAAEPYVGRGGRKLEAALSIFAINPAGKVALDVGASTGGFTDCLLQKGAERVYAVDVGRNQLHWKLRQDRRVVVLERVNARYLDASVVPEPVDLVVMDVSFISATKLIRPAAGRLRSGGEMVILVKPQFEVGPGEVGKGGIVRDPALHDQAIALVARAMEGAGTRVLGVIASPIEGADGNREFLMAGVRLPADCET